MLQALIVEDDPDLAGLIARYIEPVAPHPVIASTMEQCRKFLAEYPTLDLMTLDLALPDSTREESLARINEFREINPNCVIVVVTGSMRPEEEAKAIGAGADGFMFKAIAMREQSTFLKTLTDILKSVTRLPLRFQKNIPILEKLTEKVAEIGQSFQSQPINQPHGNS